MRDRILQAADCIAIRRAHMKEGVSRSQLAKQYGVGSTTIAKVLNDTYPIPGFTENDVHPPLTKEQRDQLSERPTRFGITATPKPFPSAFEGKPVLP